MSRTETGWVTLLSMLRLGGATQASWGCCWEGEETSQRKTESDGHQWYVQFAIIWPPLTIIAHLTCHPSPVLALATAPLSRENSALPDRDSEPDAQRVYT
jgi:hypothetical protein